MKNESAQFLSFLVGKSQALWEYVIREKEEFFSYHSKPKLPVPSPNTTDAAKKHTPHIRTQN
jgi:hypothetical protein